MSTPTTTTITITLPNKAVTDANEQANLTNALKARLGEVLFDDARGVTVSVSTS